MRRRIVVFVALLAIALTAAAQQPANLEGSRIPDGTYQTEMYLNYLVDHYPWGSQIAGTLETRYLFGVVSVEGNVALLAVSSQAIRDCHETAYGLPEPTIECCADHEVPVIWPAIQMVWNDEIGAYLSGALDASGLATNVLAWYPEKGEGLFIIGVLVPGSGGTSGWTWASSESYLEYPIRVRSQEQCRSRPTGERVQ